MKFPNNTDKTVSPGPQGASYLSVSRTTLFVLLTIIPIVSVIWGDLYSPLQEIGVLRFPLFFASCLIMALTAPRFVLLPRYVWPLIIFGVFGILSFVWSYDPAISTERAALNFVICSALILFSGSLSGDAQLKVLISYSWIVAISIFFVSSLGYFNLGQDAFFLGNFRGGMSNSNVLALLVAVFIAPLFIFLALRGKISKILISSTIISAISILILANSRGAILAVGVGAAIFLISSKRMSVRVGLPTLSVGLVILYAPEIYSFFSSKYYGVQLFGTRSTLLSLHLDAISKHPFLGYGIGINPVNFKGIGEYLNDTEKGSSLINIPEELGLPFFFFFILLMLTSFLPPFLRILKIGQSNLTTTKYLLPIVVIVISLVHSIFESWIFNFGNIASLYFWICLSAVIRIDHEYTTQHKYEEN